jgi:chromate reductase, NAD(P)H dehydrogenase (quinone)
MRIAILSTSPRKGSNTLRFSKYLSAVLAQNGYANTPIVSFEEADIPMFGRGSMKPDALTHFQQTLVSTWADADLVFVAMPEYNWMPTGEFINALSILGGKDFAHLFNNKTFALAGVSNGRGGRMPCLEMTTILNKLINFLDQYSIVSPRIFEAHEVPRNLDEESRSLENPIFEKGVQDFVTYSVKVANRWAV